MPQPVIGDYTCSNLLLDVRRAGDKMLQKIKEQNRDPLEFLNCQLRGQDNSTFELLFNPDKKYTIRKYWSNVCDDRTTCEPAGSDYYACEISGESNGNLCVDYTFNGTICGSSFSKSEREMCENIEGWQHDVPELLDQALYNYARKREEDLILFMNDPENLAQNQYVGFLDGAATTFTEQVGLSSFDGTTGCTTVNSTQIGSGDFFLYLQEVEKFNKIRSGNIKILDGRVMSNYLAKLPYIVGDNGQTQRNLRGLAPGQIVEDCFGVNRVLGKKALFMYDVEAVHVIHRTRNQTQVSERVRGGNTQIRTTIPNPYMGGQLVDLCYQVSCGEDGYDVHTWEIKGEMDIIKDPQGCDDNLGRCFKFECGTPVSA